MTIQPVSPSNLAELKRITVEGFDGTALEQNVEKQLGLVGGHDRRWRKVREIEADHGQQPGWPAPVPVVRVRRGWPADPLREEALSPFL